MPAGRITGCLVSFASRPNLVSVADAIADLRLRVTPYVPDNAFAARVHAELVRMGVAREVRESPPA